MSVNRRTFLKRATATAVAFGAARLAPATTTQALPAHADLVPLLIETERDRLLERLVGRIRNGLDFPTLLGRRVAAAAKRRAPHRRL